ncbi:aminoacyl-tRNA hydrolase [Clostridium sediminicola]|uniref:aminoacyl-tRNA hydrolase n=1 Tax=Clostridium sediminicola TaxID=3114879 RepID=UPI0031F25C87
MYLIVGLGNPGKKYEHTRHNIGFDAIDLLEDEYNIEVNRKKFKGMYGVGDIKGEKVYLLKPQTYMNLSGESVREIMDYFNIPLEKIIVIYDDISLEVGKIRIRKKGSAGGHNGIKNIIAHLSTNEFLRIKVGVGGPDKNSLVNHVLENFSKDDRIRIEKTLDAVILATETIILDNVDEAMNKYNGFTLDI